MNTTIETMKQKKIAVVVGGPSSEAEVSRNTGAAIAKALTTKGYAVETIELVPERLVETLKEKILTSYSTPCTAGTAKTACCRGFAK